MTNDGPKLGVGVGVDEATLAKSAVAQRSVGKEVSGETEATAFGKQVHKEEAELRRQSGQFSIVNEPIRDLEGKVIEVPTRVDLVSGAARPDAPLQAAHPDAVSFERGLIVDDKPLGRPVAKDRQEMIRNIEAYRLRTGELPKRIAIQRYDPETGAKVKTDLFTPEDFLPRSKK